MSLLLPSVDGGVAGGWVSVRVDGAPLAVSGEGGGPEGVGEGEGE